MPIVSHDERLLPTLKFSVKGQKWRFGKPLPEVQLPEVQLPKVKVSKIQL